MTYPRWSTSLTPADSFSFEELLYPFVHFFRRSLRELRDVMRSWLTDTRKNVRLAKFAFQVLQLPKVNVVQTADVELMMLTSRQDFFLCLLALKSFVAIAHFPFQVTILDDGTLTQRQQRMIRTHIKGCKIISRQRVDHLILQTYGKKSMLYRYRGSPYARKKIGAYLVSTAQKILYCDSDVLFFKEVPEIEKWAKQPASSFFISDPYDSYIISMIEAEHYFGFRPLHTLNSGLIGFPKQLFDPALLEKLLFVAQSVTYHCYRPPQMQVFFALLFARQDPKTVQRLPKDYVVSDKPRHYRNCRVGHYVRVVRDQYFIDAQQVIQKLKNRQ